MFDTLEYVRWTQVHERSMWDEQQEEKISKICHTMVCFQVSTIIFELRLYINCSWKTLNGLNLAW